MITETIEQAVLRIANEVFPELEEFPTVERQVIEFARRLLADRAARAEPNYDDDLQAAYVPIPSKLHPDTAELIAKFAWQLAIKLRKAEQKYGYSNGWKTEGWMDECRAKLREHMDKGDPIDVAAYCAFLMWHGASTLPAPPAQEDMVMVPRSFLERCKMPLNMLAVSDDDPLFKQLEAELLAMLSAASTQETPAAPLNPKGGDYHRPVETASKRGNSVTGGAHLFNAQTAPDATPDDKIIVALANLTKLPEDDKERINRYGVMTEVIHIREAVTEWSRQRNALQAKLAEVERDATVPKELISAWNENRCDGVCETYRLRMAIKVLTGGTTHKEYADKVNAAIDAAMS